MYRCSIDNCQIRLHMCACVFVCKSKLTYLHLPHSTIQSKWLLAKIVRIAKANRYIYGINRALWLCVRACVCTLYTCIVESCLCIRSSLYVYACALIRIVRMCACWCQCMQHTFSVRTITANKLTSYWNALNFKLPCMLLVDMNRIWSMYCQTNEVIKWVRMKWLVVVIGLLLQRFDKDKRFYHFSTHSCLCVFWQFVKRLAEYARYFKNLE